MRRSQREWLLYFLDRIITTPYFLFADTRTKLMVGRPAVYLSGGIPNQKHPPVGSICRNLHYAPGNCISISVSISFIVQTSALIHYYGCKSRHFSFIHWIDLLFVSFSTTHCRGKAGIMTPLVYYQFLVLRYSSRRNPYTRNVFYELRLVTDNFANGARTPPVVRKVLQGSISFISRLAPPMQQQQQ